MKSSKGEVLLGILRVLDHNYSLSRKVPCVFSQCTARIISFISSLIRTSYMSSFHKALAHYVVYSVCAKLGPTIDLLPSYQGFIAQFVEHRTDAPMKILPPTPNQTVSTREDDFLLEHIIQT